jgi:HEAT repeat protein
VNRQDILDILKDMAGPLGPFVSIDGAEDIVKLRTGKYSIVNMGYIETLLDILINPPEEEELEQISKDDFEFELVEMLTFVGRSDVTNFIKRVEKLLYLNQARPIIIDVLGNLRHKNSIVLLEQMLEEDLSEDEKIRLADALSDIGGLRAKEILEKMRLNYSDFSIEVLHEIDICLFNFK